LPLPLLAFLWSARARAKRGDLVPA